MVCFELPLSHLRKSSFMANIKNAETSRRYESTLSKNRLAIYPTSVDVD